MGLYNLKVYHYRGFDQYRIYSNPVKYEDCKTENSEDDFEQYEDEKCVDDEINNKRKRRSVKVSVNRTIQTIYEYAYANEWEYFVTLTFDPDKVDRNNYKDVMKKACNWCKNMHNRYAPDLKYLLVPELHKKGGYHIHALMSDCGDMTFVDSGRVAIGKRAYKRTSNNEHYPTIYNLENWKYGWSTATSVKDSAKTASYITKYITKELVLDIKNSRRFYPSNNLQCAQIELYNMPYEKIEAQLQTLNIDYVKSIDIPEAGQCVKYITVLNENNLQN